MGRVTESLSYRVKNTFVEIGGVVAEGDQPFGRLKLSDATGAQSGLAASPSPCLEVAAAEQPECEAANHSGSCGTPGKQHLTVPKSPFMPNTPSPFLHPADISGHSILNMGLGFDGMCLPPAYGDGSEHFGLGMPPAFDGQDMSGFYGVPAMMYDPASGSYTTCGWCMPLDALGPQGPPGGEGEGCGGMASEMPLEALMEGPGVSFDGEHPAEGQPWCTEGGMLLDQQGCPMKDGLPEGQAWSPEVMPMDGGMLEMVPEECQGWGPDGGMQLDQGCGMPDGMMEGQSWNPDGGMPMEQGGAMLEVMQDGSGGWGAADGGMPLEGCGMGDAITDAQGGWGASPAAADDSGRPFEQQQPQQQQGRNSAAKEGGGSSSEGWSAESEQGRGWQRGKGGRANRKWQQQQQAQQAQQQQQQEDFQDQQQQQPGQSSQPQRSPQRSQSPPERQQQQQGQSQLQQQEQQPQHQDGNATPASSGEVNSQNGDSQSGTEVQGGGYTTVMLRNIPNKYTREMLVKQLNQDFRGRFDFVYLPIDFKNRCNVGYGFINFRTDQACDEFVSKFNGVDVRKCLPGLNSRKVAEVTPARVQGLDENVRRLRNGPVMNELVHHPDWMPLLLDEDGEEKSFPLPESPCPPVKPRRRAGGGREEHSPGSRGGGGGRGSW